jgi:putative transposase
MRDVIYLLFQQLTTFAKLLRPGGGRKPGTKGPPREIIQAIVEMKRRNPRFGSPGIAQQINLALGLELDKDTVRRVLATHYTPDPNDQGPSWLTTIGHAKDSLWSVDLFRCEPILLKSRSALAQSSVSKSCYKSSAY